MDVEKNVIDFSALEVELQAAIESDAKYWRENDAKLRAVEQRVATYDEFRDIVKAAHLKPMEKNEIQKKLNENKTNIWNTISTRNKGNPYSSVEQAVMKQEDPKVVPKTGIEFTKQWRKLSSNERFEFLKAIGVDNMKLLFMSEVPVEVFGDILEVTSQALPADAQDTTFCIKLLQSLTETSKFNFNLQFLSSAEKSMCSKMMKNLHDCFLKYHKHLREEGITERTLIDLQNNYITNDK